MASILKWYDYISFVLLIVVSISIGLYHNLKKTSTKQNLKILPVSLSLIACVATGAILLGVTADSYKYGAPLILEAFSVILVGILANYVYFPVFYQLHLSTIYEYLEMRFDRKTRCLVSVLFILSSGFYLSITIYTSAITISAVSGLSILIIISVLTSVCVFYTTIGGLKTVIYSDAFQFVFTICSVILVITIGQNAVGGFGEVWKKASQSGRLDIFDFSTNPTKRDSFWAVVIGLMVYLLSNSALEQTVMQKLLPMATFNTVSITFCCTLFGYLLFDTICVWIGLIIYAKYSDCDPFKTGAIRENDQLLPYFFLDVTNNVPGLSGAFFAGILSTSLSCMSAILNCLANTIYSDFLENYDLNGKNKKLSLVLTQIVVGTICAGIALMVDNLGGIFHFLLSIVGAFSGPILGVFTLGMLVPRTNSKGAFYGTVVGICLTLCIVLPASYFGMQGLIQYPTKPVSTSCVQNTSEIIEENFSDNNVPSVFRISYYYHSVIGVIFTLISGTVLSYVTTDDAKPKREELLSPCCRFVLRKLYEREKQKKTFLEQTHEDIVKLNQPPNIF